MPDTGRQIGFEQLGIGSVLSRNFLLVPLNQRDFSWTDRQIQPFFHDLNKAISDSERIPEYFLGTIVTIPKRPGELEVVDGQQRLATTAIFLSTIRDALKGREADKLIVEHIENHFLTAINPSVRERVARLRLNVTDGYYFERRVLHGDVNAPKKSPSHELIDSAVKFAKAHVSQILKGYSDKDHGDVLNKWIEFLEHRAIVILLRVPSDVNAYKMFETLNDRGLRTSQSDLVKNYLFGESGDRLPEAQQKWTAMKSLLESVSDEDITIDFLRQILISMHGYLTESAVYETVQSLARGPTSSIQFMTKLEIGAANYAAMLNPEHEKWNGYPIGTHRAIRTLIHLGMKPLRPLMLSITGLFDPNETDRALRMLVNLSVRYLIVGGARSGSVEQVIAKAAKEISDNKINVARELLQSINNVVPKDHEFQEAFKVATVSQANLARYYLRSLEMTVKQEPEPSFVPNDDQTVINLEHIFPEKPGDNWPQFPSEIASFYFKRIGNLALLQAKTNSDLRSAKFEEKKEVYKNSAFELTRQISNSKDWNPESITRRQESMAKLAVKTWPINIT